MCIRDRLKEAFRVIDAWGFQYKTLAFLWLKQNRKADTWFYGMGFWTRSNAEVCLLATRGHPKRQSAGIHQFVISHIEQHSNCLLYTSKPPSRNIRKRR